MLCCFTSRDQTYVAFWRRCATDIVDEFVDVDACVVRCHRVSQDVCVQVASPTTLSSLNHLSTFKTSLRCVSWQPRRHVGIAVWRRRTCHSSWTEINYLSWIGLDWTRFWSASASWLTPTLTVEFFMLRPGRRSQSRRRDRARHVSPKLFDRDVEPKLVMTTFKTLSSRTTSLRHWWRRTRQA
jgi:hypothetical protein